MQIFAAVADTGQFSRAADNLSLSKSAVSHAVKDLEDYLGVQLLVRDNRNLQLTDAGHDYVEQCNRILGDIDELEDVTRHADHAIEGRIRISAPITWGTHNLSPMLGQFMKDNPNVDIVLDLTDRFVDLIQEGGDIAIRIAELADSTMIAKQLTTITMCLCASPAYLKTHPIKTLGDLRSLNCLQYSYAPTWRIADKDKEIKFTPKGRFESNSGEAIRELAIEGTGVAYLPDFMVEDALIRKSLHEVLPSYNSKSYGIYALFPKNRHRPVRVRRLIDYLAACC